jgi:metallophosphoesterase superfamily enzyme
VETPLTSQERFATAIVGHGCVLDSRRALYHPEGHWLAAADIHFGYELNRARQHGALLPQWGMAATQSRLMALLEHYKPKVLILAGDIMDGGGSVAETLRFLHALRECVCTLICVEGNHDRTALRKDGSFVLIHREPGFCFHHGHKFDRMVSSTPDGLVHITGHEHPTLNLSDGAGLRLRLPALVQQQRSSGDRVVENWILPAFSPWAGGSPYDAGHDIQEVWGCSDSRVVKGVR